MRHEDPVLAPFLDAVDHDRVHADPVLRYRTIARYATEIGLALAWTLPAGVSRAVPFAYVVFLTVLLVDRAGRDDRRCRAKYGADWDRYCERVPFKIIPYLY